MDDLTSELREALENEIHMLEKHVEYWQDPGVLGLERLGGSAMTGTEIVIALEARIKELRQLTAK